MGKRLHPEIHAPGRRSTRGDPKIRGGDPQIYGGKAPSGWLSPGLTETKETLDFLAEAGLQYVADWVNDDQPYEINTAHGPLVSLPYSVELNDIPMMVLQHHEAEEFFRRAKDQFEALYAESAKSARVMAIAVHPYISGVAHRIKYFEKTFAYLKKRLCSKVT